MPESNGTDQPVTVKAPKGATNTGDPGVSGNGAGIDSIASSIIEQRDLNYIHVRKASTSQLRGCYS